MFTVSDGRELSIKWWWPLVGVNGSDFFFFFWKEIKAWCIIINFLAALSRVQLNLPAHEYIWRSDKRRGLQQGMRRWDLNGRWFLTLMIWYHFLPSKWSLQMDSTLFPSNWQISLAEEEQGGSRGQKESYTDLSSNSFSLNCWHLCNILQIKYERK